MVKFTEKKHANIYYSSPSLVYSVSKCDFNGVQCQFWDLGGGGDLPKLWKKYYTEAHAVFFVIDSVNIEAGRLNKVLGRAVQEYLF